MPDGFTVQRYAELRGARVMRAAPNGDLFVSRTEPGLVTVLHTQDGIGRATGQAVFARGLDQPYGIAFWPDAAPAAGVRDFMTGFVASDDAVWGRPVGVTVAHDGALLVSDDAAGVIWRVAH